jgi:hypothetical protein
VIASSLIGIGLYTPAEAARLVGIPALQISRWLGGRNADKLLWQPEIDLGDGHLYLGFRDLIEVRVANAFIIRGLSLQKMRRAIEIARDIIGEERPLATVKFRADGRTVFLQLINEDGWDDTIHRFGGQHVFREIMEPISKNVDFVDGIPLRWWPSGKQARILIDPQRAFGQPIEYESAVPAAALAAAAKAEGSSEAAARVWSVSVTSVRRAVDFQKGFEQRLAA